LPTAKRGRRPQIKRNNNNKQLFGLSQKLNKKPALKKQKSLLQSCFIFGLRPNFVLAP
jgi:hypothetical protein